MVRIWLQRWVQCGMEHECAEHCFIDVESKELEQAISYPQTRTPWQVLSASVIKKEAQ